jgi:hypothetical protein
MSIMTMATLIHRVVIVDAKPMISLRSTMIKEKNKSEADNHRPKEQQNVRREQTTETASDGHHRRMFNNADGFVKAITLEEFAAVDEEDFTWVDPSEIVAGGTTCGFLHAPLGSLPDIQWPIVEVCKFGVR